MAQRLRGSRGIMKQLGELYTISISGRADLQVPGIINKEGNNENTSLRAPALMDDSREPGIAKWRNKS